VKTLSGADYIGIVKQDDASELVLATGPGAEARLPHGDIAQMEPGAVSLMPAGFDGIFTPQELADLVAFLQAAK
jgi:putative heme-binding domain-containing protein